MLKYARLTLAALLSVWSVTPAAAAARDAIDLTQAVYHNSPNVSTWAKTTSITRVVMQPEGTAAPGLSFEFSARSRWPDYTPPGWDGPIQYTVWAGVNIGGVWHVSGIIQMWRDREATGAPILSYGPGCSVNNFACNWVYDGRWGTMAGYQPRAGESMVFFVTAGNARGTNTVTSWAERSNVVMISLPANDTGVFNFPLNSITSAADFDADGRSDVSVYRPSTGTWYARDLVSGVQRAIQWGWSTDLPVTGDYDGDGRADVAVYRPSTGVWYIRYSVNGSWTSIQWGWPTDTPVPGDYNGDGRSDIAVFRPSTGTWYIFYPVTGTSQAVQFGWAGDRPMPGDWDGDGKTDISVFRPSDGGWYFRYSSTGGMASVQWGWATDVPIPGDYDGDGRTDVAVFRPGNVTFYVRFTATGATTSFQWGLPDDVPVSADYDGDGRTDLALFRPSTGVWYVGYTGTQTGASQQWGLSGDVPLLAR